MTHLLGTTPSFLARFSWCLWRASKPRASLNTTRPLFQALLRDARIPSCLIQFHSSNIITSCHVFIGLSSHSSVACKVLLFFFQAITISTNHVIVMPQLLNFLQLCAVECQVNSCQFSRAPYEDEGIGLKYDRLMLIQTSRGHRFLLEPIQLD